MLTATCFDEAGDGLLRVGLGWLGPSYTASGCSDHGKLGPTTGSTCQLPEIIFVGNLCAYFVVLVYVYHFRIFVKYAKMTVFL